MPNATSTTLYFGPWYRKSPFFEATLRWGCRAYDVYNHMYLPAYYDDLVSEYWALVNDVTLWDVGVERVMQISGPDGFALTNMLTCRDLTRCAAGQGKYAPIIAPTAVSSTTRSCCAATKTPSGYAWLTATPTCTRWAWPRAGA